jgi:RND family efflux transporter MFP subunit
VTKRRDLVLSWCLLAELGGGCDRGPQPEFEPSPRGADAPDRPAAGAGDGPVERAWVGVIVAGRAVDVRAGFTAGITMIPVEVGAHVLPGDPLALLDPRTRDEDLAMRGAELDGARARVREASIELRTARLELERTRALERDAHVAAVELERALLDVERLEAAHARARADARQVETARARAAREHTERRIVAPFAGVVSRRYITAGATVTEGSPVVRLLESSTPKIVFGIDAEEARPALGAEVRVSTSDGQPVGTASVVAVRPDADPRTGIVAVEATLACAEQALCEHARGVVVRSTVLPSRHPPP